MKDRMKTKQTRLLHRIQNQQFRKLFVKNWLLVFFSIMLPLVICMAALQLLSSRSLLHEMDTSVQRSVRNTNATLETLFEEVCDTLEKQSGDWTVLSFLQEERENPTRYSSVEQAGKILNRLIADKRENLYFSVDVYSQVSDYLASTLYRSQQIQWIPDQSLVELFHTCLEKEPHQTMFAVPRTASYLGQNKRVLTVYRVAVSTEGKRAFVSISVDVDKLIDYIVDKEIPNQGAYVIVDSQGQVLMDTADTLYKQTITLPEKQSAVTSSTETINGTQMFVSWTGMKYFGWKCVQMIPMEEYRHSMNQLRKMMLVILLTGVLVSFVLSYGATEKLFRPVEAILQVLENPPERENIGKKNDEIQFLLYRILQLFQKNMALEHEILDRVLALRRARAKALQEQMTPHFINNVLQTINWLAVEETGDENSQTSQAIILLADIINTGKQQKYSLTTVEEEIVYIKKFVELERLRYGSEIVCNYEIQEEAESMLIPSISLQTLVENSISHGFRTRCGQGSIYVRIQVSEQGGLYICVDDDGEGMDQKTIDDIFKQLEQDDIYVGEHLGLINFFQRFRLIYGEECKFAIHESKYGGVCVEVTTPNVVGKEWYQYVEKT